MLSETTEQFRNRLRDLPTDVRASARQTFLRWQADLRHPSLQFKRIHSRKPIYSVRIGIHWRALCNVENNKAIWFWIGSHTEYDVMIKKMRRK